MSNEKHACMGDISHEKMEEENPEKMEETNTISNNNPFITFRIFLRY